MIVPTKYCTTLDLYFLCLPSFWCVFQDYTTFSWTNKDGRKLAKECRQLIISRLSRFGDKTSNIITALWSRPYHRNCDENANIQHLQASPLCIEVKIDSFTERQFWNEHSFGREMVIFGKKRRNGPISTAQWRTLFRSLTHQLSFRDTEWNSEPLLTDRKSHHLQSVCEENYF